MEDLQYYLNKNGKLDKNVGLYFKQIKNPYEDVKSRVYDQRPQRRGIKDYYQRYKLRKAKSNRSHIKKERFAEKIFGADLDKTQKKEVKTQAPPKNYSQKKFMVDLNKS